MLIIRRSQETAGILPEAVAALSASYSQPFHHEARRLRSPIGIYNVSLLQVVRQFEGAVAAVEAVLREQPFLLEDALHWDASFLEAYRFLLYSLPEHLEDCETIIGTLFPPSAAAKQNPAAREYLKAVEPYRRVVARIVNHMKHGHGRLRSVVSHVGSLILLEYFADGMGPDGAVGPAIEVHPDAKAPINVSTDLRFHFAQVYITSHHLSRAIGAILGDADDTETRDSALEDRFAALAARISVLPLLITPDALNAPLASVHLKARRDASRAIRIEYPATPILEGPTPPMRTTVRLVGDGTTRSFAFPGIRTAKPLASGV